MHRLGFDLTYAWDSYSRLKAVWRGAPANTFIRSELQDLKVMPTGGMRLRFTTNHDETAWDNPPVTLFGGAAGARAAFVAMALLPGRPLIYAGQDVESPRKLGLFVRDPIAWDQPDSAAGRADAPGRTVLEGPGRRSGKRVRITAQLINVTDGYQLWSERYDREIEDLFAAQDEIAGAITGKMKTTLQGDTGRGPGAPLTTSRRTRAHLKGRELFFCRRDSGYAVPVALGAEPGIGQPRALFGGRYEASIVHSLG